VDDAQQAENNRQAETQQCVERTVDEAEQQLPEQYAQGNAEYESHGSPLDVSLKRPAVTDRTMTRTCCRSALCDQFLALAFGHRPIGLFRGNFTDHLVQVPLALRFGGRL